MSTIVNRLLRISVHLLLILAFAVPILQEKCAVATMMHTSCVEYVILANVV